MTDLRALLGEHMSAVYDAAAAIQSTVLGINARTAEKAAVAALAAVLPDLLAEAWDEGHRDGRFDAAMNAVREDAEHVVTPNPYREMH